MIAYQAAVTEALKRSMPPTGSDDPVLLILGSLPGEASLAAQRYYAHPQNQFWRLLGDALGDPFATLDCDRRLASLALRGVALWDVVGEAFRRGSLDGALREVQANPLTLYIENHPQLRAIAFNGQAAAKIGRRALGARFDLMLIDLPSSSPAYTIAYSVKAARWRLLGELALAAKPVTLG